MYHTRVKKQAICYDVPMISRLTGTIVHIDPKYLVLDVGGVGYKVFISWEPTLPRASDKVGKAAAQPVTLWTYLAVRDDALDLYGFRTPQELAFFELLIGVSGIGPKTAMGILSVTTIRTLEMAIRSGETSHLTKVSGIGKKNAEKIVRELEEKIYSIDLDGDGRDESNTTPEHRAASHAAHAASMRGESDVIEALKALGYRESESRDVLKKLDKSITDTGAKVKAALKILNSQ